MPDTPPWFARGLLFENCSCQTVCPGHVHFDQRCTYERCVGYWAFRIDAGRCADTDLAGVRAVVAYDCPQHMIDGDWVQTIVIDERSSAAQRRWVEAMLCGELGGPWAVLARFVGRRLPTDYRPILIEDDGRRKRVSIAGLLESTIEAIRGRDRARPVTFENMFNQIHATSQVIARGDARYADDAIAFTNTGSHGLYSTFEWTVSGG
jgi:hypothetical protein